MKDFFFYNFPRKLVALLSAIVIWFWVHQSLTASTTLSNIPVRVINLAPHLTIAGRTPEGFLKRRISLTLRGNKDELATLDPHELEIVINAEGKEESFVAKIDEKNLHFLEPDTAVEHAITDVSAPDLFIKITPRS